MKRRVIVTGVMVAFAAPVAAQAQAVEVLAPVEVIATAPTAGAETDKNKIPGRVQTLSSDDIQRAPQPDVTRALEQRAPSVSINNITGNDFQPEVNFRGFTASPLPGTQQGLAVYQNGVRINEPFGDAVNWDLIPSNAIDQATIVTNNPAFGLNALGGALTLRMKNGFTFKGVEADLRFGSFGRKQAGMQYGVEVGPWASYIAAEAVSDNGWRRLGGSEIRRVYGDIGWRGEGAEVHLNVTSAINRFGAAATTPAQMLQQDWGSIYTNPQSSRNAMTAANLTGTWDASSALKFAGNLYVRSFERRTIDGNVADTERCSNNPANVNFPFLCLENDPFPGGIPKSQFIIRDPAGNPVLFSALGGGLAGSIERTNTKSLAWGGALQATHEDKLGSYNNKLVMGLNLDMSRVDFTANSELGIIQPDLSVAGTGVIYHTLVNGGVSPVGLGVRNAYAGIYALDTLDVTDQLSVTAGGRFNHARIALTDKLGTALNGVSSFARFNPVIGATYKFSPTLSAYAGYSEANRAPTPLELGCADKNAPCLIDNFLTSDPPLKQVVSKTVEAGLRGEEPMLRGKLTWSAGVFSTMNHDDIIAAPSAIAGRGFYTNAGRTRRQGVELEAGFKMEDWSVFASYALLDATFRTPLTLPSPNNPAADANGNIAVAPGATMPGASRHRFKAGFDWKILPKFTIGADMVIASGFFLRGDEANLQPKQAGYFTANLRASWKATDNVEVYGLVNNILDNRYAAAGGFFNTGAIPFLGLTDARSLAPATPRAFYAGMKVKF